MKNKDNTIHTSPTDIQETKQCHTNKTTDIHSCFEIE